MRNINRSRLKEESMYILFKNVLIEFLESLGIDIDNPEYESLSQWKKLKKINVFKMSLEDFVKIHLLADANYEQYDYDMTDDFTMEDENYEDGVLAEYIVEYVDNTNLAVKKEEEIERCIGRVHEYFTRLKVRLEKYLNFELEKFDKNAKRNKKERSKILFFFYMLEKVYLPDKEMLTMFDKKSMENIERSKMESFNGMIIKFIKRSLEQEIDSERITEINNRIAEIVYQWDEIGENANVLIDFLEGNGYKYDFEKTIEYLNTDYEEDKKENDKDLGSPIEVLYLKIIQHEYLCNINDIREINSIPNNYEHNLPAEFIQEMKELHKNYVDLNNIEKYMKENARRLANYVYHGKANPDNVKTVKKYKKKIGKWIKFCYRAKPYLVEEDIANELQIVSLLQALILDSQNESFDYTYYNHELLGNHHSDVRVQAALKNDNYVVDILKCYWVRKVVDRWYTNIGRWDIRTKIKRLEDVCDDILIKILSKSSLSEMKKIHNMYMDRIDLGLITAKEQIMATMDLEKYLFNRGFTYVDVWYKIRYIFSNPKEINGTYNILIKFLNDAIQNKNDSLEMIISSKDTVNNVPILFNLLFSFDYQKKECTLEKLEVKESN